MDKDNEPRNVPDRITTPLESPNFDNYTHEISQKQNHVEKVGNDNYTNLCLLPVQPSSNLTLNNQNQETALNRQKTYYVVRSSNNEIIDQLYLAMPSSNNVDDAQAYITLQPVQFTNSITQSVKPDTVIAASDINSTDINYSCDYSYYEQPSIEIVQQNKPPPLAVSTQLGFTKVVDKDHSSSEGRARRLSLEPRTCTTCNRAFKYPSDLKKHEQIHTETKKYICKDCGRMFRRVHQLNVHSRIHTGEKPYVCHICNMPFRHDSTLTMHIRTRHQNLKPFECEICKKMFGRLSHLRKHQRYVCATNRKIQLQSSHPYANSPSQDEYPAFECRRCSSVFMDAEACRDHENSCTVESHSENYNSPVHISSAYAYDDPSIVSCSLIDSKQNALDYPSIAYYDYASCENNIKEGGRGTILNNYPVDYHHINSLNGGSLDHEINNLTFPTLMSSNQINGVVNYGESASYIGNMDPTDLRHLDFDTSNFLTSPAPPPNEAQTSSAHIESLMKEPSFINGCNFIEPPEPNLDKPNS